MNKQYIMRYNRLLVLCIISVLAVFLAGAVCAADNVSYFNNTTKITFEDVDFLIPTGFGESKAPENYDGLGSEGQTCFYINEANGEIIITVISDWMGISLDELKEDGAVKTTLNGYKGWNYTDGNLHYFSYIHDDKGIIIGVTNQTRLAEVVIAK